MCLALYSYRDGRLYACCNHDTAHVDAQYVEELHAEAMPSVDERLRWNCLPIRPFLRVTEQHAGFQQPTEGTTCKASTDLIQEETQSQSEYRQQVSTPRQVRCGRRLPAESGGTL